MLDEIIHIITDPAHWVGEVVMDGTITLLAVYPIRKLINRHDRKVHGKKLTPPAESWDGELPRPYRKEQ